MSNAQKSLLSVTVQHLVLLHDDRLTLFSQDFLGFLAIFLSLESPGKITQTALDNCTNYKEAATFSEKSCHVSWLSYKVTAFAGQLIVLSGNKKPKKILILKHAKKHMHF